MLSSNMKHKLNQQTKGFIKQIEMSAEKSKLSISVLLLDDSGRNVLLLKKAKPGKSIQRVIPGGGVDTKNPTGTDIVKEGLRELEEEAGITKAKVLDVLSSDIFVSPSGVKSYKLTIVAQSNDEQEIKFQDGEMEAYEFENIQKIARMSQKTAKDMGIVNSTHKAIKEFYNKKSNQEKRLKRKK